MNTKLQYRIQMQEFSEWTEWRDYNDMNIYTQGTRRVQIRTTPVFKKGMVLTRNDRGSLKYVVLDETIHIEKMDGGAREFIACKVIYDDGDWSFDFVAIESLSAHKIGE